MRVQMRRVEAREARRLVPLPSEELHHAHTGQSLGEKGVDARQPRADLAVGLAHAHPEHLRHPEDPRDHHVRCERHPPIHHDHQHRDREQREEVAKTRDHTRGEQFVERLDVGRDTCDEPSDRIAIEEGDRQPLQMCEELPPKVVHHALTENPGEQRLQIGAGDLCHQRGDQQHGRLSHQRVVAGGDRHVDHAARHQRRHELQRALDHQHHHRAGHEPDVGTHVLQQATGEAAIEGLAERFFLVLDGRGCGHDARCHT